MSWELCDFTNGRDMGYFTLRCCGEDVCKGHVNANNYAKMKDRMTKLYEGVALRGAVGGDSHVHHHYHLAPGQELFLQGSVAMIKEKAA